MKLIRNATDAEIEKVRQIVKKTTWYRQAAASKLLYIGTPSFAVQNELPYPSLYCLSKEFEGYYDLHGFIREAQELFEKTAKSTADVDARYTRLKKIYQKLEALFAKLSMVDFSKIPLEKLQELIMQYEERNFEMWYGAFFVDKFDPEGDTLLKQAIKKHNLHLSQEEINILIRPQELNFIEQSNYELCQIAEKYGSAPEKERRAALESFARKWFYVQNSWNAVTVLTANDFIKPLKELTENPQRLTEQLNRYKTLTTETQRQCAELCTTQAIPQELKNLFHLFRTLTRVRDGRKKYVLLFNHYYELAAQRCAAEWNIEKELLYHAFPRELALVKKNDLPEFKERLARRKKTVMGVYVGKKLSEDIIINGEHADEIIGMLHARLLEKYELLRGMVASRGNAKIVTGTVKIILGETHFTKFNTGDILVAAMTRPEYVPLMKKAKAIITDEGGITCHAAIVSRELGVPCIIGTQVATKKLQDNRTVEIDVENGTVRMI